MSEYTPGPWREYDRNELGDIYLCGNGGRAVAIVLQAIIPRIEGHTEANARVIAAAPDMLGALRDVLFAANNMHVNEVHNKRRGDVEEFCKTVRDLAADALATITADNNP